MIISASTVYIGAAILQSLFMGWTEADVVIDVYFDPTLSEGDFLTLSISTPVGDIQVLGHVEFFEPGTLIFSDAHIAGLTRNALGWAHLRQVMNIALERGGFDEIIIKGSSRSTGANPGHIPRPFRVSRSR
ncbi:hypothetical protein [Rhizobium oryzicola]|uniref:Uncharacterized protein n=1 Tax=Rhizobium oryzicola TaxID=1232668 RepID=A0ABT8ST33_9HYPH|nr:hypothetical protein [Rhizobium oryzicola]MDO1581476.1 hypothetical protein [Rhizobium oryzicola]